MVQRANHSQLSRSSYLWAKAQSNYRRASGWCWSHGPVKTEWTKWVQRSGGQSHGLSAQVVDKDFLHNLAAKWSRACIGMLPSSGSFTVPPATARASGGHHEQYHRRLWHDCWCSALLPAVTAHAYLDLLVSCYDTNSPCPLSRRFLGSEAMPTLNKATASPERLPTPSVKPVML